MFGTFGPLSAFGMAYYFLDQRYTVRKNAVLSRENSTLWETPIRLPRQAWDEH
jgi:hypothetical protein